MRFIGSILEKLQRHPKRIVFPEGTEPRVVQAARQFYALRLGIPILLGERAKIKKVASRLSISLEGIRLINPPISSMFRVPVACKTAPAPRNNRDLKTAWLIV